jgi:hypothetical protein
MSIPPSPIDAALLAQREVLSGQLPARPMLQLQYHSDCNHLVARWRGPTAGAELEEGYWAMLVAAQQVDCRFWLIDARLRGDRVGNNQEWFLNTYMPTVSARFLLPVHFSYLIPPSYLYEVEAEAITPPLPELLARGYRVQAFVEEQAARAWLVSQQ